MRVIHVRNVHQALPEGLRLLSLEGVWEASRNGSVLVNPTPVMTVYNRPSEKVLFWGARDANPFFHLAEGFWMLAGRNNVDWISYFNAGMEKYSDDGVSLHGAYGYRWRSCFGFDQLEEVVRLLQVSPASRRAVIAMWSPSLDLHAAEDTAFKDLPCNTHIYLRINKSELDLTVMCRSNDIIWGAYGTNAVHFAMLQEYLAARLGCEVGKLYQLSNNYHAYLDVFEKNKPLIDFALDPFRTTYGCPYTRGVVAPSSMVIYPDSFLTEVKEMIVLCYGAEFFKPIQWKNNFIGETLKLFGAFRVWKEERDYKQALKILGDLRPTGDKPDWDWRLACGQWVQRRLERSKQKDA